ncbi:MAG TPA: hypothetical protein VFR69_07165 [Rubrobacteraceae bacterium]|nr:hypothetical protein [Rubrobacteraceae bacterium]
MGEGLELFGTHELVRPERGIPKIEVPREGDGAFAVVDIDTVWRDADGNEAAGRGGCTRRSAASGR